MTAGEVIEVLQRVPADTPVATWNCVANNLLEVRAMPTHVRQVWAKGQFEYCTTGEAKLAIEMQVE